MATAMKKCRVCGKLYEACHTAKYVEGVFRWQDVTCSRECGDIYLAQIKTSRGEISNEAPRDTDTDINTIADNQSAKFPWSDEEEAYESELAEYFGDE